MKKLNLLRSNAFYTDITSIVINNPRLIEKGGKLTVNLPNRSNDLIASAKYVEYENDENYSWIGELADKETFKKGEIQIIAQKGEVFGNINFEGSNYLLSDLGKNSDKRISYLIKTDEEKSKKLTCGAEHDSAEEKNDTITTKNEQLKTRSNGCPPATRVLVLYNDNAYNANPNVNQVATSAIAQLNTILGNSAVSESQLRYTLAGVDYLNFQENNDPSATVYSLRDNSTAQNLRAYYSADLVILLTQFPFANGTVVGAAFVSYNTNSPNDAYGVVNINGVLNRTFSHEIGHLLGCEHETYPSSYFARGFIWTEDLPGFNDPVHKTVMHTIPSNSIPYFSNPNVTYGDQIYLPTGTTNNYSVAKIIFQAPAISNWNSNNDECMFISGDGYIYNSNQSFTWCANGSYPIQSVSWAFSVNGYNYTTFANGPCGSKVGSTFPPYYSTVFIRMIVTIQGGTTITRVKTVTNWSYYNYFKGEEEISSRSSITHNQSVYPNPVKDIFTVTNIFSSSKKISYNVLDVNGKTTIEGI